MSPIDESFIEGNVTISDGQEKKKFHFGGIYGWKISKPDRYE